MIYIVSGFMRSGTSMMMEALQAGGMDVAFSKERDKKMNDRWGDIEGDTKYVPNEKYYELNADDYRSGDFPSLFEGKLIKCLSGGMLRLPPTTEYRIIFMRRKKEEIIASMSAAFGNVPKFLESVEFDSQMENTFSVMKDRRSVRSINEIWYDDVIRDPKAVFKDLDWPIDIDKAAAIPQKNKARFSQ